MLTSRTLPLAGAALLLAALPLALAHGENDEGDKGGMDIGGMPGVPTEQGHSHMEPASYWVLKEGFSMILAHVALMIVAWCFVLPVAVMFSVAQSRYTLPAQFLFLLTNAFGLLVGVIYNKKTPDMYENTSHNSNGWAVTWIASIWVLIAIVNAYTHNAKKPAFSGRRTSLSAAAMAQYQRLQQLTLSGVRGSSRDSGHGTEPNTASLDGHSRSPSEQSEGRHFDLQPQPDSPEDDDDEAEEVQEKRGFLRNTKVDRFLSAHVPRFAVGRTLKAMRFCSAVLDRFMLMLGFIAISTGAVTWGGIAHGDSVFNILAHFIKGGIFFWYGLLTLGRWMGCWADLGWAWNIKPGKELVGRARAWAPSAEFTESFVICLYGASNVWLEHLAASQQDWDAMDLEHVSISILFFGGGLLGMLVESAWVRDMLSTSITYAGANADGALAAQQQGDWEKPEQYRFPMNPIPALVILLLGIMMGQHHQAAMLSTKIHAQWGNLFAGFSMARAVTYITLYISPPKSYLPSRPPSELVSAWCLIAGGITFIVSNKDTVSAMELYNLDAMFSFTVTMGLTGFICAWEVVCLALRGWAVRRENKELFQSQTVAA